MSVNHRINIRAGIIDRRVDHRFPRRVFELGDGPCVAGFGVVLFANLHVFVDIHQNNMFRSDFAERRENRFDEKLSCPRYARAHVTVIIGQTLVKHDAVT